MSDNWVGGVITVVVIACGLYLLNAWSNQEAAKQEALCDVALSHVETLEARAPRSAELKNAKKAVSDACDRHDYYAGD